MAIFLNTNQLNEWIPRLINETQRELVIIVPYIKTSFNVLQSLQQANERGVEITLVYRENKLSAVEKAKFEGIDNLNLMHHPNVHCKCYYNEKYLLLTSMNMYEYSQLNNREMGVLLHRESLHSSNIYQRDDDRTFEDAIQEIKAIINGSQLEKKSRETIEEGFEMDIIKTEKEKAEETCKIINRAFIHKRFEPVLTNNKWFCTSKNYFDKINVTLNGRAELFLQMPENQIEEIFKRFLPYYHEYRIDGFKLYWNHHKSGIYLYPNGKHVLWKKEMSAFENYQLMKSGIDELISFLRKFM